MERPYISIEELKKHFIESNNSTEQRFNEVMNFSCANGIFVINDRKVYGARFNPSAFKPGYQDRADKYAEYLKDKRWSDISFRVRQRDGFRCRKCGASSGLNAHHTEYVSQYPWETPIDKIITLCKRCHSEEHSGI